MVGSFSVNGKLGRGGGVGAVGTAAVAASTTVRLSSDESDLVTTVKK